MRQPFVLLILGALGACSSTPIPPADPQHAWVDMYTTSGRLMMADRLDGKHLADGRYFQVTPGQHELVVRLDFEVFTGFNSGSFDRICYLTVPYNDFAAGQRYRLEARVVVQRPEVRLYDAERKIVATDRELRCLN
ncbi:hypothetical protein [Pseudomonas sp. NA-150]|uniref:PA0061/PA0062 family lipoprotein n=1 Tax=Pseudomonas sp. NA-150 TaxID=3367525 RepID=UPI0037CB0F5A